jgi:hypothetical protein
MKPNIKTSRNYDQFVLRKTNRPVSQAYVKQLIESIDKNDLTANFPILVNERNEIIDGQHRFAACVELGLPIHYTVIDATGARTTDDIMVDINTHQRTWRLDEFVNMYARRGVQSYIDVENCMNHYKVGASNAFAIVSNGEKNNSTAIRAGKFKSGKIHYSQICEALLQMRDICPFALNLKFVTAFTKLYCSKGYNHDNEYKKFVRYRMDMQQCATSGQYAKMFESIVNKRKSANEKISINV